MPPSTPTQVRPGAPMCRDRQREGFGRDGREVERATVPSPGSGAKTSSGKGRIGDGGEDENREGVEGLREDRSRAV